MPHWRRGKRPRTRARGTTYVRFPVELRDSRLFHFARLLIERGPLGPSVSIIKSASLGAMPTNHSGTCAAAFLFLSRSAVQAGLAIADNCLFCKI